MSEHILQLNEFFVEGGDQRASHVLLHITEPSTPEEQQKGYFFAICEMNDADTAYISKLQELIDTIETNYYELPDEAERNALEIILERVNRESRALMRDDIALSCIVGALRQPDIIISAYGRPHVLLLYKNRQGLYQQMNLVEEDGDTNQTKPPQLFGQIIQGKISPGDYLFAATLHITDYFTPDRLQKIITSRPPEQSAEHIERVLADLKGNLSFGGLIIHAAKINNEEIKTKPRIFTKGSSRASLTNLFTTEKNTASTLSPNFFGRIANKVKPLAGNDDQNSEGNDPRAATKNPRTAVTQIKATHIYQHHAAAAPNQSPKLWQEKLKKTFLILGAALKFIARTLVGCLLVGAAVLQGLFRAVGLLFYVITNLHDRRRLIIEDWKKQRRNHWKNLIQLPLVTKIIIIGVITAGLVFVGSIVYIRAAQKRRIAINQYNTAIQIIKSKRDEAESALVYHNESTALVALNDAKNVLSSLACDKLEKNTCDTLRAQIENLLVKARRLTIARPELLTTWLNATPTELLKINGKLLGYSTTSSSLTIYDLLTKESRVISGPAGSGFIDGTVPKENDYILLNSKNGKIWQLDPNESNAKTIDISYPDDSMLPNLLTVYNRRLYSLVGSSNQIYKHDNAKTGFSRGKEWLKDTAVDLKDSSDLTIDGDVFVFKNNGQIIKFTGGMLQPFAIQGLDPALTSGGKIWTYNDLTYLYILDPVNKRLIIVNKDGTLERQITAAEFEHPTGMVIDEANNAGFILDGAKLYKISLR